MNIIKTISKFFKKPINKKITINNLKVRSYNN